MPRQNEVILQGQKRALELAEDTGLGLALCKKIVERHGGSITATARENTGAKFTIQLPAK